MFKMLNEEEVRKIANWSDTYYRTATPEEIQECMKMSIGTDKPVFFEENGKILVAHYSKGTAKIPVMCKNGLHAHWSTQGKHVGGQLGRLSYNPVFSMRPLCGLGDHCYDGGWHEYMWHVVNFDDVQYA